MMGGRNHLFLHQKQLTALVMDPGMGDSGWLPKPRHSTAMPCPASLGSEQPHCVGLEQTSVLPEPHMLPGAAEPQQLCHGSGGLGERRDTGCDGWIWGAMGGCGA